MAVGGGQAARRSCGLRRGYLFHGYHTAHTARPPPHVLHQAALKYAILVLLHHKKMPAGLVEEVIGFCEPWMDRRVWLVAFSYEPRGEETQHRVYQVIGPGVQVACGEERGRW